MTNGRENRGEPDRSKVNVRESCEVEYWSKKFGVSPHELRRAVRSAGTSPLAVKAVLRNK